MALLTLENTSFLAPKHMWVLHTYVILYDLTIKARKPVLIVEPLGSRKMQKVL